MVVFGDHLDLLVEHLPELDCFVCTESAVALSGMDAPFVLRRKCAAF